MDFSPELVVAFITLTTTLIGVAAGIFLSRNVKNTTKLEKANVKLKQEVRARIAQENLVCEMLVELGRFTSAPTAKVALREAVERAHKIRPRMTPSDVA